MKFKNHKKKKKQKEDLVNKSHKFNVKNLNQGSFIKKAIHLLVQFLLIKSLILRIFLIGWL